MNEQAVQQRRGQGLNIAEVTFYSVLVLVSCFCRSTFQPEGQRVTRLRARPQKGTKRHAQHETARVHYAPWQRSCLAARGARATAYDAGGRLSRLGGAWGLSGPCGRVPPGIEGRRIRRRRERRDRLSLGKWPIRSIAGACSRVGSPPGSGDFLSDYSVGTLG